MQVNNLTIGESIKIAFGLSAALLTASAVTYLQHPYFQNPIKQHYVQSFGQIQGGRAFESQRTGKNCATAIFGLFGTAGVALAASGMNDRKRRIAWHKPASAKANLG